MPTRSRDITAAEAAERLQVSQRRVYDYIATGRLPAVRSGGTWLINQAALEKFAAKPRAPGRPEGRGKKPGGRRR